MARNVAYPRSRRALAVSPCRDRRPARWRGCGGGTDVDYTKASETVRASLESKREGFGAGVESVECPSGVKVDPGTHFECTVRCPDGKVAYAQAPIRDAKADLSLEIAESDSSLSLSDLLPSDDVRAIMQGPTASVPLPGGCKVGHPVPPDSRCDPRAEDPETGHRRPHVGREATK